VPSEPRSHADAPASGGGSGAGRLPGQDAELVAFGIGERDPAAAVWPPVIGQLRCPECEDPLGLLLARAVGRPEVQVDPVWDGDEEQELAPVSRGDQAFLVTGLVRVVRIFDEVQNIRLEDRLRVGIQGVKRRVRYAAGHYGSLDCQRRGSQPVFAAARRSSVRTGRRTR
jgi:hypothetical protein